MKFGGLHAGYNAQGNLEVMLLILDMHTALFCLIHDSLHKSMVIQGEYWKQEAERTIRRSEEKQRLTFATLWERENCRDQISKCVNSVQFNLI